jgi:hypothetical protein
MRERIVGLTDAIRQVMQKHDHPMWWKDICDEIRYSGMVSITPEQEEQTYGQPNFHHSVRKRLSELVKRGETIRVSRGVYQRRSSI